MGIKEYLIIGINPPLEFFWILFMLGLENGDIKENIEYWCKK